MFLLGKDKRHELGLRLTPGIGVPADGSKGDDGTGCTTSDLDPFRELRLDGPELVATFDIGYAPRF